MRELQKLLRELLPDETSGEVLRQICSKAGAEWLAKDAWGRPFLVERSSAAENSYRVTSLGRDGKRGDCCKRIVRDLDQDAVLEGDQWLQAWPY